MSTLVVLEQRAGEWNRMSFETMAAAQSFGPPVHVAVVGRDVGALAAEAAKYRLEGVHAVEHELLGGYTADGYSIALRQLVEKLGPELVVFPHTYQVRDFGPKLAASMGRLLVSDAVARTEHGFVRQVFQGKLNAEVGFLGEPPYFASLQAGAWRADTAVLGEGAAIETFVPELRAEQIRVRPMEVFRDAARAVDLGSAEIIVSVGRGIKESDNLPVVQKLADALGAELAASRPICDSGWMPMERQIGSSGQTVAPKLYVAVGISGAIQHLVGMKGSRTIVAINRDAEAPIFEVADYGIVGDLFEVVPAIIEQLSKKV